MPFFAGELGFDKCFDDLECERFADDPAPNAQDVDIVMFDSLMGRVSVVGDRSSNSLDLVGRHTGPGSRPTDHDAAVGSTVDHRFGDGRREVGIVDGVLVMGAEIENGESELGQAASYQLFEGVAGMVGSEGDAHRRRLVGGPAAPASYNFNDV